MNKPPIGEVSSEEGYQNLRRFLFGRWAVSAALADATLGQETGFSSQLDMRLSIRGLVRRHERADDRALVPDHADGTRWAA